MTLKALEIYAHVNANSNETDPHKDPFQEAENLILQIYPPFLLAVGITGNMVTILILRSKSLRHNFVALYLTYLAIFNILNLALGLTRLWIIGMVKADIRNYSQLACRLHSILTMVFHVTSNWLMTAVTTCKLMYVHNPVHATRCCTKVFVHMIVFTMCVCFVTFEIVLSEKHYIMVNVNPSGRLRSCDFSRNTVYHILQVSVFYIVPGSLIIIMNIFIILKVRSLVKSPETKSAIIIKKERIVRILAAILFACDIQILLNELPYAIQHMFGPSLFEPTSLGLKKFTLLYHISSLLLYTNCSVNFVIYCFFGDHFREELRRIFRPCLKYICQPHSRWVESTVDEESQGNEHPVHRKIRTAANSSDLNAKLSLLNLFDTSFTESYRFPSRPVTVYTQTTTSDIDQARSDSTEV